MRPTGAPWPLVAARFVPALPAPAVTAPARDSVVALVWRSRSNILGSLRNGSVDGKRAFRAPSLWKGFVDTSMYVALPRGSKNTACTQPDTVDRIFRKLRLAVFWRM